MSKTIPQLGIAATLSLTDKGEVSQSDSLSANSLYYTFSSLLSDIVNNHAQLAAISQVTGLSSSLASKLSLSGGTMTGELILAGDPTFSLDAATKLYVDNTPSSRISGTANQVNVGIDGFDLILSTPQDINTAAAVKFGALGINLASTQSPNAAFQVDSTTKGELPARMTTAQMNNIPVTPRDAGLRVYVTDLVDGYYYFNGANWVYLDNNSGAGNTLQAAYGAGNTISLTSGIPVIFSTQGVLTNFAVFSNGGPATHVTDTLVGTQFTPSSDCFVTSLMYVNLYFSSGQRQVGIYRVSDQALMVSDLVYKSDPLDSTTNYRVHTINPVPLKAGVTYIVLAIVPANESYVFYSNALVPTPGISNTGVTFGQTASTLIFPTSITTSANLVYGNGSFQFSVSTSTLNINDGTQSALLEAISTVQGTLPFPSMSTSQFAAIPGLKKAMMGFDNVLNKITGHDGSAVQTVPWDSQVAHLTGNETIAGTKTFSSTITANISGNAATAIALQTARTINGISFDGTANITIPAAAGTLTGTTLNSTVVSSSLTSVGTIASGTWSGSFGAVSGANLTNLTAANISAGTAGINITGNSATTTQIGVTTTSANNTFFPIFVGSSSSGNQAADVNSTFTFNPLTGLNVLLAQIGAITSTTSSNTALQLFGPDSSNTNAPAIGFFTNADSYPLMNLMPFTHGNSALSFDAYYAGSWLSSYSGSNFQIQSLSNILNFNFSSGNAQGSAITWGIGMSLSNAGVFNFPQLNASQLLATNGSKNLVSINSGTYGISITGTATNANNVAVTQATNSANYFLAFVVSSATGNQNIRVGTGLTFNPSTNVLSTTTFSGTATNATNGTTISVSANSTYYPLFAASSVNSNQPFNLNTAFNFNPSTTNLTTGGLILSSVTAGITRKSVAVSAGVADGSFNTGVTLVAGTVTISNSYVTALCSATVTVSSSGGTPSLQGYRIVVGAGTYTITGSVTDTSVLNVAFTKGN